MIKNLPAMQETWIQSLGWEDSLEKRTGYPLQYFGLKNSMDCKKKAECRRIDAFELWY